MDHNSQSFTKKIDELRGWIDTLNTRSRSISHLRLFSFLVFLVAFFYLANARMVLPLLVLIAIFAILFAWIVRKHGKIRRDLEHFSKLLEINQEEIARINHDFSAFQKWDEFKEDKHPYSSDLDLYGSTSLFQLINRGETDLGIKILKKWLEESAAKDEIESRQQAIQELAPKLNWRQDIQAYARRKVGPKSKDGLFYHWLKGEDKIRSNRALMFMPYLIITLTTSIFVMYIFGLLPYTAFFLPAFISSLFISKNWKHSTEVYEMTLSGLNLLTTLENICQTIENEECQNVRIQNLKNGLFTEEVKASESIGELRKLFEWLNQRNNGVYQILNLLSLSDFIFLGKAEQWRFRYRSSVQKWFEVVGEIEALCSMAAYAYTYPEYTFPIIEKGKFQIEAKDMGHPLIPRDQRVVNNFSLEEEGSVCMITGSNMAGKSTFLRTLGINTILALAGAPVCASSFRVSVLRVFTSMRTRDNLEENISSFYAELLRLKMLLGSIDGRTGTLFLLDEILKGTNSIDRHIGAESLAIQLSKMNAFGLISTHDLKLGELRINGEQVDNFHFSSQIINDEIVFDYLLKEGICTSTNASKMMANMGIDIKNE